MYEISDGYGRCIDLEFLTSLYDEHLRIVFLAIRICLWTLENFRAFLWEKMCSEKCRKVFVHHGSSQLIIERVFEFVRWRESKFKLSRASCRVLIGQSQLYHCSSWHRIKCTMLLGLCTAVLCQSRLRIRWSLYTNAFCCSSALGVQQYHPCNLCHYTVWPLAFRISRTTFRMLFESTVRI